MFCEHVSLSCCSLLLAMQGFIQGKREELVATSSIFFTFISGLCYFA